MSAWIESHQSLRDHPRKDQLAEELFVGRVPNHVANYAAVGILHYLWWWALDYAQDGDLTPFSDRQIARACRYIGDPQVLVAGLTRSGFLTAERRLHNWYDYAGRLIEKREANAARTRAYRVRTRVPHALGSELANRTVPNRTEAVENPLANADASPGVEIARDFDVWWATYGKIGSKAACRDNYRWWRTTKEAPADELLHAAIAYRAHCEQTDCKIQHGSRFLAKSTKTKSARWPEWAAGEEHGALDIHSTRRLNDVLEAGAEIFELGGGDERGIGSPAHPQDGQVPGRSLPPGSLAGQE